MRTAVLVALRDLRGRLRDRSAWITALVAPVLLAGILSLAFGGGIDPNIAVAPAQAGENNPAVRGLLQGLRETQDGGITIVELADDDAAQAAVADERVDAAIVVGHGRSGPTLVVYRRAAAPVSADIAEALARGAALNVASGGMAVMQEQVLPGRSITSADYYGPAMATFFVFFVMAFGPLSLIAERREGTLARLAASPIRMRSVLLGKGLAVFVLAMVSVSVVWLLTTLVFDANWGDPLAVLALVVAVVLAAGALTTLAASGARTERQADGQVSAVVFVGALFGGNFLPLETLPAPMQTASYFTPNGWAMRGFTTLSTGDGLAAISTNIVVLLAMAAFAGGLAMLRARRALGVGS